MFDTLRQALAEALAKGSKRLLATYLQTLLAYPDGCNPGRDGLRPPDRQRLGPDAAFVGGQGELYPKEQALVDLVVERH